MALAAGMVTPYPLSGTMRPARYAIVQQGSMSRASASGEHPATGLADLILDQRALGRRLPGGYQFIASWTVLTFGFPAHLLGIDSSATARLHRRKYCYPE